MGWSPPGLCLVISNRKAIPANEKTRGRSMLARVMKYHPAGKPQHEIFWKGLPEVICRNCQEACLKLDRNVKRWNSLPSKNLRTTYPDPGMECGADFLDDNKLNIPWKIPIILFVIYGPPMTTNRPSLYSVTDKGRKQGLRDYFRKQVIATWDDLTNTFNSTNVVLETDALNFSFVDEFLTKLFYSAIFRVKNRRYQSFRATFPQAQNSNFLKEDRTMHYVLSRSFYTGRLLNTTIAPIQSRPQNCACNMPFANDF